MGQSLSKMSKPTALHTEGTAQVSEWLNRCGDNDQIAIKDLKLKFISIRKVNTEEEKVKHTNRFKNQISVISAKVKQLRQIGAEMV